MSTQFTETLTTVASEFGVTPDSTPRRKPRQSKRPYFKWTDEMTEKLVSLIDQQKTVEEIAVALCIPLDRVKSKFAMLKAKVPSIRPSKTALVEVKSGSVKLEIPKTDFDRIIFAAFSEFVGLVDDYDCVASCWRDALRLIEQQLDGCTAVIAQHPETKTHLCKVAAIIAYDDLKA